MARKPKMTQGDIKIDLTAMIDVIFLLIIFFILAGRITSEMRSNEITVPPARTAQEMERPPNWRHAVVEVYGNTTRAGGGTPRNTIKTWLDRRIAHRQRTRRLFVLRLAAPRTRRPLYGGKSLRRSIGHRHLTARS